MIVIKQLGSHVDLQTGEDRHSMVVGLANQDGGFEVDIDGVAHLQLRQLVDHLRSGSPDSSVMGGVPAPADPEIEALRNEVFGAQQISQQVTQHLRYQLEPEEPTMTEARLEAHLRELEAAAETRSGGNSKGVESPEDLLRQVGWFDESEEVEGPADALADAFDDNEDEDPGEDYPEDDGVEGI